MIINYSVHPKIKHTVAILLLKHMNYDLITTGNLRI